MPKMYSKNIIRINKNMVRRVCRVLSQRTWSTRTLYDESVEFSHSARDQQEHCTTSLPSSLTAHVINKNIVRRVCRVLLQRRDQQEHCTTSMSSSLTVNVICLPSDKKYTFKEIFHHLTVSVGRLRFDFDSNQYKIPHCIHFQYSILHQDFELLSCTPKFWADIKL